MKEKGGEGRERKERDIYIYKIYRVAPLLSAGVETTRAAFICSCILYMHLFVHAHIHIQVYSLMRAHTHIRARIRTRMRMHMHMTHTSARA